VHSPEEYVSKAVQVATDRDYRKYVTERIAQASDVLFNDLEAVREHERFFEEVLAKHGIGL
jgi:predicted O-linked N-acetylglucosamine transferase (SPINDLY family)